MRAEFTAENVIHRKAEKFAHLVADAALVKELAAVGAGDFDDVEIALFAAVWVEFQLMNRRLLICLHRRLTNSSLIFAVYFRH